MSMHDADEAMANYPVIVLGMLVWREARSESDRCKLAVGWTVRERVFNAVKYDGTEWVESATKKWQYSSMAAPGDRQLIYWPKMNDPVFHRCLEIAVEVIQGYTAHPLPGADSYHDISIPKPATWPDDAFMGQIDRIRFYRLNS